MKVFVTGATGFLGGHFAEALVLGGHEVKTLARPTADTSLLTHDTVEVTRGELSDPAALEGAMRGCEVVYHLAATTSRTARSREECFVANVEATRNVAHAVQRLGIRRLVFCSTAAVYGVVDRPPVDEESQTKQDSPYAESKLAAERLLLSSHREAGLPVVVVRFPGLLGRRSLSWTGLFGAIASGHFRIIGTGANHTHTCHVDDIVEGLQLAGTSPGIEGRTYNLAAENAIPIRDFIEMIAVELGVRVSTVRIPVFPYRALHRIHCLGYRHLRRSLPMAQKYELFLSDKVMSIARARSELGFAPRRPLTAGIRETIGWYREQGLL